MADTLDVLTLTAAKQAINMSLTTSKDDDRLQRDITMISRVIDDACGPVVQRTVTAEQHDGGCPRIRLRRRPVVSITTVEEARIGAVATLTEQAFGETGDGYIAPNWPRDPSLKSGIIHRRRYGTDQVWWPGSSTVQVTYEAGRFATTATVDPRFVECAGTILRRLWKRESGVWSRSPDFVSELDSAVGVGFFRVAEPYIKELLWDEMQVNLVGFA